MLEQVTDTVRWWLGAGKRRREQREAAWREAAARQDGVFTEDKTSFWQWAPSTIDAPIGDAQVHVDLHSIQVGNTRSVFTRARADYILGVGPKHKVYREGWSGALGTMFFFEDVKLGDPNFDDAFIVRTADVEATRRAWSGRARTLMAQQALRRVVVQTTQQRVSLLIPGVAEEAPTLEAAIVLVGDLASYGWEWLEAIRAVPEAEPVPSAGPWDDRSAPGARLRVRDHAVHLHPVILGARLRARATSICKRRVAPFELQVDEHGVLFDDPPDELFGPLAVQLLPSLPGATIGSDGAAIRVTLDIESRTGALHHAAELAAHLALGEGGTGGFR